MSIEPLRVRHSETLYRDQLGGDLYLDLAALLWEMVRNHCIGCMNDPKAWSPETVRVELQIVTDWTASAVVWAPKAGARCLFIFDRGHGFRDDDFERFGQVGPVNGQSEDRYGGGSQKCMGRFAGLPCNEESKANPRSGYMVYTSTTQTGPVIAMEATSAGFAEGSLPRREIPRSSPELGPYRNHTGSFSLTVIPNCVFETHDEIIELLKWYMPRKRDRAIDVRVGGKKLVSPPLAKEVITYGGIEAYLDKRKDKDQKGGLWLCDMDSGLRCAHAPAMSQHLPWPLGKDSLVGEIFIKGLYKFQNTSRSGLKPEFFKSKAWKAIVATLQLKIAPFARELLDLEEETFGETGGLDRAVTEMAEAFHGAFGLPSNLGPGVWDIEGGVIVPPVKTGGTPNPGPKPDPKPDPDPKPKGPDVVRPRRAAIPIIIDGKTYHLAKSRNSDEYVFAALAGDEMTININPIYPALPTKPGSKLEHMILGVLRAVADSKKFFYGDARKGSRWVSEIRDRMKRASKKPKA